ncbi:MAG: ABC transporter permease [Spirochaetaceae bacterium]|nr:ABC transporter permease [Spirochaetaceae bacterium]
MSIKGGGTKTIGALLLKTRTIIALVLLVGAFTAMLAAQGINFLNPLSLATIAKHIAKTGILGIGMTFVILTGGIDLSIGATVGLCGMVAGFLIRQGLPLPMFGVNVYYQVWAVILICLVIGALIGAVNGFLITRLGVAPFIATLGTMYIARGFANILSGGATYPDLMGKEALGNTGFPILGAGKFLELPISVWIMIALFAIMAYIAKKTPLGRHIYAIGGNPRASRLSGIKVEKVTTYTYIFAGFCAAIVGLILASELVASHPANGSTFEMNAIAAAVLGGTSLSGGIGTIGGTIIGSSVMGVLYDGMVMMNISEFWQNVFKGVVIILAIVLDQANQRMNARMSLTEGKRAGKAA